MNIKLTPKDSFISMRIKPTIKKALILQASKKNMTLSSYIDEVLINKLNSIKE